MEDETPEKLSEAVDILRKDGLVAFPTETVYGLGANALSETAVKKIFMAKGRPSDNPLIVHISSMEMLEKLLYPDNLPPVYYDLCQKYWPGPLTILVPKPKGIPDCVTASQETVAIRMPAHPIARKLIEACGFPLAAPSANTSGRPSPTLAQHVFDDLNDRIPLILDGGVCQSGVESTVLDGLRSPPAILRPGGITFEMIQPFLSNVLVYKRDFVDSGMEQAPTTPGMKYRHYTPDAQVILITAQEISRQRELMVHEYQRLIEQELKVGCLVVGDFKPDFALQINLGSTASAVAQSIFSSLRYMEHQGAQVIIVQGIPESDEGLAVMNRLRKAASNFLE